MTLYSVREAEAIATKSLPALHPLRVRTAKNVGNLYGAQRNLPAALSSYRRALEMAYQVFSAQHPEVAIIYNNIANVSPHPCADEDRA